MKTMMKENLKAVVLFLIVMIHISCENNDDQPETTLGYDSADLVSVEASVKGGAWYVSEYNDDDDDDETDDDYFETIDFEEFVFEFDENGTVIATVGGGEEVYTGIWKIELNDDDDDDKDEIEFDLEFNSTNKKLQEISEDWDVLAYSDTQIRLGDDDNDDDDELLVFEKI